MKSLRAALVFLGIAGIAVGLFILAVILTSDRSDTPEADAAIALLVGWSFIGTGLFAWWRRPLNRTGALMAAVGFTWFLAQLAISDVGGVFIAGIIFNNLPIVMLAHLILAFPSGHLESRAARWVVIAGYVDGVFLALVGALVLRNASDIAGCPDCPDNPIALIDNADAFTAVNTVSAIGGVVLLGTMVWLLVRRRHTLGGAGRQAIMPVLLSGGLTLAMLGSLIAIGLVTPENDELRQVGNIAAVLVFATVPFAFLLGLLRARFSSATAVGELIEALSDAGMRELNIRDALAGALADSELQLAYWLPDREAYVDETGRPIDLPAAGSGRSWSTVEHDGELIAAIVFDSALDEQQPLIRSAGAAAALALRNQRLAAELRANLEELRASRARIVQASDEARRQLERNLHDGAQQHLVSMALNLRMARNQMEKDPQAAAELIDQTSAELAIATDELRELARGIHPAVLSDRGLAAALDALASRSPVFVELGELPANRLPAPVEAAAYFVVAEAVTNVVRYAGASKVTVDVSLNGGAVTVTVTDDGCGGADPNNGTGLRGLNDRVAALDGKLTIVSDAGAGTVVKAEIPCAS